MELFSGTPAAGELSPTVFTSKKPWPARLWMSICCAICIVIGQQSYASSPPEITSQPLSQAVSAGATVELIVGASGTAPLGYHWVKDGHVIAGATASTLVIPLGKVTDSGVYYAVVTNAEGCAISGPARVAVGAPVLFSWGKNSNGQLGNGSTAAQYAPAPVATNVVAAAAGGGHSLFLKSDGTLWAMGANYYGQLGDGTYVDKHLPEFVASNVVSVAAGESHSLFLKGDGTVWAMGTNGYGQLGDGTTTTHNVPESVASGIVAIAAGANHSLLLKTNGTLWAMGYNLDGELGDGTTTASDRAVAVQGGTGVMAVWAGAGHTLFVKSDGSLWGIGYNQDGELGDATTINRSTPVSVLNGGGTVAAWGGANHTLFARGDGTLWTTGYNTYGQLGDGTPNSRSIPENIISGAVGVSAGWYYSLFLKSDGSVWAMGQNNFGQLGDGTTVGSDAPVQVTAISAATVVSGCHSFHSLAVGVGLPPVIAEQPLSQVLSPGEALNLSIVLVPGTGPFTFQWYKNGVALAGETNTVLTKASAGMLDSGVYRVRISNPEGLTLSLPVTVTVGAPQLLAWGDNDYGQLGDGTTQYRPNPGIVADGVMATVAGADHTLFVKSDNSLWAVGYNGDGELGDGSTLDKHVPEAVGSNVVAVAAGAWHSLYLTGNGTLWGMGANYDGQLGDGTLIQRTNPVPICSNVVAMAAGFFHSLLLKSDGTLWAMGYNEDGELGNGNNTWTNRPGWVASNVVAVAAGGWHSLFVKSDGSLWVMGANSSGQLGNGSLNDSLWPEVVAGNVVAVAAGNFHSVFLKSDGTLWGMGYNEDGELGDGTWNNSLWPEALASNVAVVTAGIYTTLHLKNDGSFWATGNNSLGQYGDGTLISTNAPVQVTGMSLATVADGPTADHTLALGAILPPVIAVQPESQLAVVGREVAFTVSATGVAPLGYQWQFNGEALASATASGYTISSAAPGDAGSYSVIISNPGGNTTSIVATLTVSNPPPPTVTVTVTANPSDAGSVTGEGTYEVGTNAILSATPFPGWRFLRWNNGITENPYTLRVPATNSAYTAEFAATATITLNASPGEGGSVSGGGTFLSGSTNIISATASNGWIFTAWGDASTSNPRSIVTTSNVTLTATFVPAATISTVAFPPEGGTTAGDGTYAVGSTTLLTAAPTNGWVFLNWNGVVTNNPWNFTVPSSNITCTATFAQVSVVTALADPTNAGSVTGGGTYLVGSNVVLTPTASSNWLFTGWSDGTTTNPYAFTAPATNLTITAQFVATATIMLNASPSEGGSVSGGGTFLSGSTNVISATASNGWIFTAWSDASTSNPRSIVTTSNVTLTATFVPAATISTVALPPEGGSTAGDGTYAVNSAALLTATPTNGWIFMNWNGAVTNNPWTFTVPSSNTTCTATFAQVSVVTALADPTNAGSVSGGGTYLVGSNVVLTATASSNWLFTGWSDGTSTNPYAFTAPATNFTITAQFVATATLTVEASPSDAGFVSGGGTFLSGSTNVISATASNGWIFTAWSDASTSNPRSIVTTSNVTLTATFVPAATISTVALPPEGGSTAGDGTYAVNSAALLTATPTNGWIFMNWNGAVTNNPWTFTVPSSNTTCTATFAQVSVVTALADPTNAGSVSGGGTYLVGSNVVLTATASSNWLFTGWSDGTTTNPYAFTAPATNLTVTAQFVATATLSVEASPSDAGFVSGGGTFVVGTTNIIRAVGSNDWVFVHWNDGVTNNPRSVVVESNRVFTAEFTAGATVTAVALPSQGGSISGQGTYVKNADVTLQASAAEGWIFLNWNGAITNYSQSGNTNNPLIFKATADVTNTANFAQVTNGFVYIVMDTTPPQVEIIGYVGPVQNPLVIPSVIDGMSVTVIATGAFWWMTYPEIVVPGSVTNIQSMAIATDILEIAGAAAGLVVAADALKVVGEVDLVDMAADAAETLLEDLSDDEDLDTLVAVHLIAQPNDGGTFVGAGLYTSGDTVTLKAIPNSGWKFKDWVGSEEPSTREIVVEEGENTYTAEFVKLTEVTVEASPEEGGTVSGGGTFEEGTTITLTAVTNTGWRFTGWDEGTPTTSTYEITVPAEDVTHTAHFIELVEVETECEPTNGGYVTGGGTYDSGTPVTLQAWASPGWQFTGWFHDGFLTNAPIFVTVASPLQEGVSYSAHFERAMTVVGAASPPEAGSVSGGGVYALGDTNIILTATASNNWVFTAWSDGTTNNPYNIPAPTQAIWELSDTITYTAKFSLPSSIVVGSSNNPCGYKDPVAFTATVTPGDASGTIRFLTNGVLFATESLTGGTASSPAATLPRGTNLITAQYSGDGSHFACTNTFQQVVTNHPPHAAPAAYTLTPVSSYKILISDLSTNWTDADGDTLTLASVNASTNGGTVSFGGKYIYYSDANCVADMFTYVISDGCGGTGTGTVNLASSPASTNQTLNVVGLQVNGDGSVTIHFAGIPGYTYWVESATDMQNPVWAVLSTNVAGTNGLWNYTDTTAAGYPQRYYRTYQP